MEKNKRNYSDYSYFDSAEQIKRLKRDTKEEIIVYPNLYNKNLPNEIYCDDEVNKDKLTSVFERYCPRHFKIHSTEFIKSKQPPVCRVRVWYEMDTDLPGEGSGLKALTSLLLKHVPINCFVFNHELIKKEKIIISYGLITCECDPPDFSGSIVEDLHN